MHMRRSQEAQTTCRPAPDRFPLVSHQPTLCRPHDSWQDCAGAPYATLLLLLHPVYGSFPWSRLSHAILPTTHVLAVACLPPSATPPMH
jgi:hypothetical protein